jgi:hypothetical protein
MERIDWPFISGLSVEQIGGGLWSRLAGYMKLFGNVGGGKYGTLVVYSINLQYSYDNILLYG